MAGEPVAIDGYTFDPDMGGAFKGGHCAVSLVNTTDDALSVQLVEVGVNGLREIIPWSILSKLRPPSAPRWVPVEERMPFEGRRVLIGWSDHAQWKPEVAETLDGVDFHDFASGRRYNPPTHWLDGFAIPEAPRG